MILLTFYVTSANDIVHSFAMGPFVTGIQKPIDTMTIVKLDIDIDLNLCTN